MTVVARAGGITAQHRACVFALFAEEQGVQPILNRIRCTPSSADVRAVARMSAAGVGAPPPALDKGSQLSTEPAEETDEEFLARMEAEDRQAFQQAVQAWRDERAAGGGEAQVVEAGGAFVGKKNEADKSEAVTKAV